LARTKGSKNKNSTVAENTIIETEPEEKKTRGRKKGQTEPKVIWQLNDNFRIKVDSMNFTGQMKTNQKEETDDINDSEDIGWKLLGHHAPNNEGLINIFKDIVTEILLLKAKKNAPKNTKEIIINSEQFVKYFEKSVENTEKMFAPLKIKLVKMEDI